MCVCDFYLNVFFSYHTPVFDFLLLCFFPSDIKSASSFFVSASPRPGQIAGRVLAPTDEN